MMKCLFLLTTVAFFSVLLPANAQQNNLENEIINLDKAEAAAVLKHDTLSLETLWAESFTVNTPYNVVNTRKRGDRVNLHYNQFDRTTEKVMLYNDSLAVTMGSEVVNRKPPMTGAGQVLTRRFTHVWMKRSGSWQLAARHANFICPDMPQQQLK
ncbi:nuclear transport factor 2 family protein [Flavisolibacter sp. BT320]|nr:nuclear transport factor 2 family protein [Flavisolibacter longurius]